MRESLSEGDSERKPEKERAREKPLSEWNNEQRSERTGTWPEMTKRNPPDRMGRRV